MQVNRYNFFDLKKVRCTEQPGIEPADHFPAALTGSDVKTEVLKIEIRLHQKVTSAGSAPEFLGLATNNAVLSTSSVNVTKQDDEACGEVLEDLTFKARVCHGVIHGGSILRRADGSMLFIECAYLRDEISMSSPRFSDTFRDTLEYKAASSRTNEISIRTGNLGDSSEASTSVWQQTTGCTFSFGSRKSGTKFNSMDTRQDTQAMHTVL
ncbi:hypothetical protein BJ170DRAFT_730902 [Xylariales sp. AK1849]|nr:hypothetical protein BJ170DRAFT_730902 [Xylariales sp. AK1849]